MHFLAISKNSPRGSNNLFKETEHWKMSGVWGRDGEKKSARQGHHRVTLRLASFITTKTALPTTTARFASEELRQICDRHSRKLS